MSLPFTDALSLPILVTWLRINWVKIVLGGVVCMLLTLPVTWFKSKTYDSAATLLVFPPTFKDHGKTPVTSDSSSSPDSIAEMMPRALPVETYKVIALSAPLLDAVIHKVPLEKTGVQALRSRLEVELVQMGVRSSGTGSMYTQALMFHAKARSPELAAKMAEAWAEVFKEQVDDMAAKGVGETFSLLETLHSNAKTELDQADLALAEHLKAWNLDLIEAQLNSKRTQFTEFEADLKKTAVDLASGEMKLKAIEGELAKEPQKNVYFRAPSDDAYWIAGLQNGGEPKTGPDKGLRTEEPNETYIEIRSTGVTDKEEVEGLKARKDMILTMLDDLKKEIDALTATLADKTIERDKLTRESDSLDASYTIVRAEYEKGRMANRTQASDIVIAGKAVVPDEPIGTSRLLIVLAAAFAGMLLTGGVLALKEISEVTPLPGAGAAGLDKITDRAPSP